MLCVSKFPFVLYDRLASIFKDFYKSLNRLVPYVSISNVVVGDIDDCNKLFEAEVTIEVKVNHDVICVCTILFRLSEKIKVFPRLGKLVVSLNGKSQFWFAIVCSKRILKDNKFHNIIEFGPYPDYNNPYLGLQNATVRCYTYALNMLTKRSLFLPNMEEHD